MKTKNRKGDERHQLIGICILFGVMRRAYNIGRYDSQTDLRGIEEFIKGERSPESYLFWKTNYILDKKEYAARKYECSKGVYGTGGYRLWTQKAVAQDYVDGNAARAIRAMPGISGILVRITIILPILLSNAAGCMMKTSGSSMAVGKRERNPESDTFLSG